MATKPAANTEETATREDAPDGPLMDAMGIAVKRMLQKGKERGYITYDELNQALPPDQMSSEQIEDVMTSLSEMGVNVVDAEESEETAAQATTDAAAPAEEAEEAGSEPKISGNVDEEDISRTHAPGSMSLREMGSVGLLS